MLLTFGLAAVGCNQGGGPFDAAAGSSTTGAGSSTTASSAAPAVVAAVAVAYTRTVAPVPGEPAPPTEHYRTEISLDGASFRRVTSLRWLGPSGASFTVTLRPENGDPKAKQ